MVKKLTYEIKLTQAASRRLLMEILEKTPDTNDDPFYELLNLFMDDEDAEPLDDATVQELCRLIYKATSRARF